MKIANEDDAVNGHSIDLSCDPQELAPWQLVIGKPKLDRTRSITVVSTSHKSINNENSDYPPEGNFIFLDIDWGSISTTEQPSIKRTRSIKHKPQQKSMKTQPPFLRNGLLSLKI